MPPQHTQKIEVIRQKCIEANPSIKEEGPCETYGGNHRCKDCGEIIGREIRFTDVLLALAYSIQPPDEITAFQVGERFKEYDSKIWKIVSRWDWKKDSLSDQSLETIEFIYKLIK